MKSSIRKETDTLGSIQLPTSALYGIHTARTLENFPITNVRLKHFPELLSALAMVKKAAVLTNVELGVIDASLGQTISQASCEIIDGKHHECFLVDMIKGGAGASTNMALSSEAL